jgi:glycosidase
MSLEGATLEGAMMHMAFILSVRGIPQFYYGEEIAMEGGHDPDNRRDFPGGFPGDARSAFEPQGRKPKEQQMYDWTRAWIRLRTQHPALRRGQLIDMFYDNDTYVFARQDKTETVIIAINRSDKEKKITVPAGSIGVRGGAHVSALIGTSVGSRVAAGTATLTLTKSSLSAFSVR